MPEIKVTISEEKIKSLTENISNIEAAKQLIFLGRDLYKAICSGRTEVTID